MDIISIFSVIIATLVLVGIPSFLIYRTRFVGIIDAASLALAAMAIMFSAFALFFGYSPMKFLILWTIFDIALLVFSFRCRGGEEKIASIPLGTRFLLLMVVFLIFISVPIISNVPFDTDSQGFGLTAMGVRDGGGIRNLAPYYPEIEWAYSPAFFIFTAFFSDIAFSPIYIVMPAFSVLTSVMVLLLGYRFGNLVKGETFGLIMAGSMLLGTWLFTAYFDTHYTTILATVFLIAFVIYFFKCIKEATAKNVIMASVFLAALAYSQPDSLLNLLIVYVPFYLTIFLAKQRISAVKYGVLFGLIPVLGVLLFSPYLIHTLMVLIRNSFSHVPFAPMLINTWHTFIFGGVVIPLLAVVGTYFAIKRRRFVDVFMITWFAAIIEFSSLGVVHWLTSDLPIRPTALFYPPSVSWHGSILPFSFLASLVIYQLIENHGVQMRRYYAKINIIASIVVIILLGLIVFGKPLLAYTTKYPLPLYGEFSTGNDVGAMVWIRDNTPKDALILNYPLTTDADGGVVGWFEGHWVPVISERRSAYFRDAPFYFGQSDAKAIGEELVDAYLDPANSEGLIRTRGVDYIFMPEAMSGVKGLRWREMHIITQKSSFDDVPYLRLVHESGKARVYEVI